MRATQQLLSSDTVMKVTNDAVQVLGRYVLHRGLQVERMTRDAKIAQTYGAHLPGPEVVIKRS